MEITKKAYKKLLAQLPSLADLKKIMIANNSAIPTRIKVGDTFYFDSNHWVRREETDFYVGTYINLVGGKIGTQATTQKDAKRCTESGNEEMITKGRVR